MSLNSKMADEESDFLSSSANALWDPLHSKDWDKETVTPQCILRIKRSDFKTISRFPSGLVP